MSDRAFADSNILIYVIDPSPENAHKSAIARELIERTQPVVSTQVLGEFYNVVTSAGRPQPLDCGGVQVINPFNKAGIVEFGE